MEKILKRISGIVLVVLFVITALNFLFKYDSGITIFQAEWTAGEALTFLGSIVGAVVTIIGVYWGIQSTQHQYRQDELNRVLPFIATEFIERYQNDTTIRKAVFELTGNNINIRSNLRSDESNSHWNGLELDDTSTTIFLTSVGNGVALNVQISFGKEGEELATNYTTLRQNEKLVVQIFQKKNVPSEAVEGKYALHIDYEDILGTLYTQSYPLEIVKVNGDVKSEWTIKINQEKRKPPQCEFVE
ncbi:MAG: hypothetical protein ACRDCC_05100 [Culicoidibacterales bacterium]